MLIYSNDLLKILCATIFCQGDIWIQVVYWWYKKDIFFFDKAILLYSFRPTRQTGLSEFYGTIPKQIRDGTKGIRDTTKFVPQGFTISLHLCPYFFALISLPLWPHPKTIITFVTILQYLYTRSHQRWNQSTGR
jgi:hypothetical protein